MANELNNAAFIELRAGVRYSAPPAVDDDTKKMVLELCDAVQEHVLVWTYPCGKQTLELAKQIREKLEVGNEN